MRISSGTIFTLTAAFLPIIAIVVPLATAPLLVLIVAALLTSKSNRDVLRHLARSPTALLFGGFVVWALISLFWTPEIGKGARTAGKLLVTFGGGLFAIRCAELLSDRERKSCGRALVAGTLVAAIWLAIDIHGDGAILGTLYRLTGGPEFHQFALNRPITIIAMLVWPALLAAGPNVSTRLQWLLLIAAIALFMGSSSATATVGLIAGAVVFALGSFAALSGTVRKLTIFGLIAAFLALPLFQGAADRIDKWDPDSTLQNSFVHRVFIWDFAASRAMEKPLAGWGIEASRGLARHIRQDDSWQPGESLIEARKKYYRSASMPLHPHSAGLQIWVELGMVGILLLCAALYRIGRVIDRSANSAGLRALLVTGAAIASAGFGIWQSWWLSTIWLSVILAVAVSPRREDSA